MKRFALFATVAALIVVLFLLFSQDDAGNRSSATATSSTEGSEFAVADASAQGTAASSAASRQPGANATYEFKPPVFRALPGGLNGRPLRDIYDELAKLADNGDVEAARVLGDLVDDCADMLKQQKQGKRFGSSDPLVQKFIEERERIAGKECPALGEDALASASAWYTRATEGGDRRALMRLQFHPPKSTESDAEAKTGKWRKLVIDRFERLANNGDFEAMVNLADFYFEEGNLESTKAAYLWFDRASRAPVNADRIEHVSRMRDIAERRIAADEQRGR